MSTLPPWGTPHPQSPATEPGRTAEEGLALIVEQQSGSGEGMVWRVEPDPWPLPAGTDRAEADRAALHLARTFEPSHPWSKKARQIYRLGQGSYLVIVRGATKTFHFKISVAESIP